jgi:hypothetical protein
MNLLDRPGLRENTLRQGSSERRQISGLAALAAI